MRIEFLCNCTFAASAATTDKGRILYANWDACEEHGDGYATTGFALLLDEIKDLRAALKTSQDYGEELTATIAERDATIADMQGSNRVAADTIALAVANYEDLERKILALGYDFDPDGELMGVV